MCASGIRWLCWFWLGSLIHCLGVGWLLVDLGWPQLEQVGWLGPVPQSFIFQLSGPGMLSCKRKLFKLLLEMHYAVSHWPNHITWLCPELRVGQNVCQWEGIAKLHGKSITNWSQWHKLFQPISHTYCCLHSKRPFPEAGLRSESLRHHAVLLIPG